MDLERLTQRLSLHDIRIRRGAMLDRIDPSRQAVLIDMNNKLKIEFAGPCVAERNHVPEFPSRVYVQQREGQPGGIERLHGQMQQNRGILADRIQHHRTLALGHRLANNVDALRLKLLKMGEHPRAAIAGRRLQTHRTPHHKGPFRVHWVDLGDYARADSGRRAGCRSWSPHSLLSSCSHHHRPARSGSPGPMARVQGAHPIDRKPRSCRGLWGMSWPPMKLTSWSRFQSNSGLTLRTPWRGSTAA